MTFDPLAFDPGLTAVRGLEVGHAERTERPTGCTVILARRGAIAGVDVRGGAPGSRELALLDPVQTVQRVHAVMLAGGSAFGLEAAGGVMRYLESQGIGFKTGAGAVPIVPASILYDLEVGGRSDVRPDAACGERAARAAQGGPVAEGSVGAGAGASVGKIAGHGAAMRGGLGSASWRLDGGATVAALIAVNAFGDVIDPATGEVVAGTRDARGGLADARRVIYERGRAAGGAGQNTTIGVVATDAALTKAQTTKLAVMAQDGLARCLYPAHTPFDGDTLYALATGEHDAEDDDEDGGGDRDAEALGILGAVAADLVVRAVLRAVHRARGLPDLPALGDAPVPPR
ncbi:MAG: P1 family peptidase [Acidobacteriota bacterium]